MLKKILFKTLIFSLQFINIICIYPTFHLIKEEISKYLPSNPIIVEAGAHKGWDSVEMAKAWPNSKIYAFEPIPSLFNELKRYTAHYKNIFCFKTALSNSNGFAKMYVNNNYVHDSSSSLLAPKEHLVMAPHVVFDSVLEVPTITLDHWAITNGIKYIDFLWFDMQGYEPVVLQNSIIILKTVKVIFTEVNFRETYEKAILFPELDKWLTAQGFILIKLSQVNQYFGDAIYVKNI